MVSWLDVKGLRAIPGVGAAQRGWLTADDVINTWPLDRLRALLTK
jgi:predicted oxidoreductase